MEEDDDFGDLYTDVLLPFATPSHHQEEQRAPAASEAADLKATSFQSRRPIDLNSIDSDDDEILYGASDSNSKINNNKDNSRDNMIVNFSMQPKTLVLQPEIDNRPEPLGSNSDRGVGRKDGLAGRGEKSGELDLGARVLDKNEDVKLKDMAFGGSNIMDEDIDVVVEERDDKDNDLVEIDDSLPDRNKTIGNLVGGSGDFGGIESSHIIPGLSTVGMSGGVQGQDPGGANYDDYDSDSEDDLQIVLNNDNELGAMGVERIGGMEDGEDDEDGDPLVIVADNDALGHQPMKEDQDWGEEGGTGTDGEKKELGDAAKVNGGVAVPPKVPYGNVYHHPLHSQFKYVRPGAASMPGAAPAGPGGTPGQVRPPLNLGPVAGRGRGDWRPAGVKGGPLIQKGFHPGYGAPVWGSNVSGRGLEFTLPSHKTIFEVDIDSFEEKPWKLQGIDLSNFFNFGLNEESWKEYCKQLEQHRLETTMQSRIRVYESGRAEQAYDPDLPPELAAASGAIGISAENINLVKTDAGQDDSRGSAYARPPIPTGRPIQVETNYTDRLPSIDTRQPRIRDSDAIIEIDCHDSADEGSPEHDTVEPQDDEISNEDRGGDVVRDSHENSKKEPVKRRGHLVPISSESSMQHYPGSREGTPQYSGKISAVAEEDRRMKGRTRDSSPRENINGTIRDRRSLDVQKEKSTESVGGPLSSSPLSVGAATEQEVEYKVPDESVREEYSPEVKTEGLAEDVTFQDEGLRDESIMHSSKRQKLSSRVEQSSQEKDDEEDSKAARSSDNSKARSGSSKDFRKSRDGMDEEVVQGSRSAHKGNTKRAVDCDGNMIQYKGYDERKHTTSSKGKEESYSRKGRDVNSTNHFRENSADRRRESENTERAFLRSDNKAHGRRARVEDTRKREYADEFGSRHQNKIRQSVRSEKDECNLERGDHDKDMGLKHRSKDADSKRRDENIDSLPNKRRKEEASLRREQAEKEVVLHGHRESTSRRKRERDDVLDERKRDDQLRLRDDEMYNVRHKEEGLLQRDRGERQRDRDEWHRIKHSDEEMISKREREEGRSGLKNIRAAEEKVWLSHSRGKEEFRGSDREYHQKDIGRHSEQPKRRDRIENENLVQHKGREDIYARVNLHSTEGRRARNERVSTRDDRATNDSDSHRVHEKKPKEYPRKGRESERGDLNSLPPSGRNQDEYRGPKSGAASPKGKFEYTSSENVDRVIHQSAAKHNEDVTSDDELLHSRRGRSKLERWTSHKERDFSVNAKSSLQIKDPEAQNVSGHSLGSKVPNEPPKSVETKQRASSKDKDVVMENNDVDGKLTDNKHLDTVEKLKKRSERFKLPMPIEKETVASKKVENEPPPASSQGEICLDTEIKPERPARKRRWTSN